MKRLTVLVLALVFTMGIAVNGHAENTLFLQGFETNTDDWFSEPGDITQVPSGTNGIPSADGSYHAEVNVVPNYGGFTRFGEYRGDWPGFIRQSLDVYIDPAAGNLNDGWWLDNAINCSEYARTNYVALGLINCNPAGGSGPLGWLEAGGLGAKKVDCSGTPGWALAADGDGAGNPSGGGVCITTAGWYTIISSWVESSSNTGNPATDGIDRDTFIYNSGGTLIYQNKNPNQHLLRNAGGNRYGWLNAGGSVAQRFAGPLAIDNSKLAVGLTPQALDHFQCYGVNDPSKLDPAPIVDLYDQFGLKEDVNVKKKAKFFCAPVDKNGEGITNPENHLTCYDIKGAKPKVEVTVNNQFGDGQTFDLKKAEILCVPSEKL